MNAYLEFLIKLHSSLLWSIQYPLIHSTLRIILFPFLTLFGAILGFWFTMIVMQQALIKTSSYTSILVTGMRCQAYILGLGEDHMAIEFLPLFDRLMLLWWILWSFALQKYTVSAHLIARTKFGDDAVKKAVDENIIKQVVVLGAGNDTRFYRLETLPEKLFEVDSPGTQMFKRTHIPRDAINANVRYVAVDFEKESWMDKLKQHDFDPSLPTLFLWEGVLMYLTRDAIHATLQSIGKCANGSRVVFDFAENSKKRSLLSTFLLSLLRVMNEPFISHFTMDEVDKIMKEHCLRLVNDPIRSRDFKTHANVPVHIFEATDLYVAEAVLVR